MIDPDTGELLRWRDKAWREVKEPTLPLDLHDDCRIQLQISRLVS